MKSIKIYFLIATMIMFVGCVNKSPSYTSPHNLTYEIQLKKIPFNLLNTSAYKNILIYEHNNTNYLVYNLNSTPPSFINYTAIIRNKCLEINVSLKNNMSSKKDYITLLVVETNIKCVKINGVQKEITNPKECYKDADCIHKPSPCHTSAQNCIPYYLISTNIYDLVKKWEKELIVCTMECRPCLQCKCIEGKCVSENIEGCC